MANLKRCGQPLSYSADISPLIESYTTQLLVGCWLLSTARTEPLQRGVQGGNEWIGMTKRALN